MGRRPSDEHEEEEVSPDDNSSREAAVNELDEDAFVATMHTSGRFSPTTAWRGGAPSVCGAGRSRTMSMQPEPRRHDREKEVFALVWERLRR